MSSESTVFSLILLLFHTHTRTHTHTHRWHEQTVLRTVTGDSALVLFTGAWNIHLFRHVAYMVEPLIRTTDPTGYGRWTSSQHTRRGPSSPALYLPHTWVGIERCVFCGHSTCLLRTASAPLSSSSTRAGCVLSTYNCRRIDNGRKITTTCPPSAYR